MSAEEGALTAVVGGTYTLGSTLIACPHCRAGEGLTFTAFPIDTTAIASCPNKHTWDEPRLDGHMVRDLWLAFTGQPTRATTITQDGQQAPRERCPDCLAYGKDSMDLKSQIRAAEEPAKADLQMRLRETFAAWVGHMGSAHLGPPEIRG